ncbi:PQQ-dependent sugar dehydrogenase [Psychromicrobium lacuslunae]|uniref:PQQ-dependent sugar dehydrogenase n=1 Tax=Psychromicrobium lacuslunae TaxID=1618207 RepID=UPI0005D3F102|nr:PQQ-dependent sugar dehydrogenase [Psychromicrobium lacuslunae]
MASSEELRKRGKTWFTLIALAIVSLLLGACVPSVPIDPQPSAEVSGSTSVTPLTQISGLSAPWSMVEVPGTVILVSERDSGRIMEVLQSGGLRVVGTVSGVSAAGEGGLLGLAYRPADQSLYAYFSAESDNRIVKFPLHGAASDFSLGPPTPVLSGLAKANNHNGGRIAFGPDGKLYVGTGDAGATAHAQDPASLNGKILRLNPDGSVPADNPTAGSLVYSSGHRNVQGLAWDAKGRLWASEFGQNTWDELNLIKAGGNYGWPEVEGEGADSRFINPALQWKTSEASPSGLTASGLTLYMAALKGERLWRIDLAADGNSASSTPLYQGQYGRLRDALISQGNLLLLTNNTDGRGSPRSQDDRILRVPLTALR